MSPLAKKVAGEMGVSLQGIQGSGPNNRVLKQDVVEAAAKGEGLKAAVQKEVKMQVGQIDSEFEDIPVTNIRKVIAERLTYSKTTVPHY